MITLKLDENYDLCLDDENNLAIQNNELLEIAQTLMNRCSLVRGEAVDETSRGIDLGIMLNQDRTLDDKKNEIKRVILMDDRVLSVEQIDYKFDPPTRNGYFIPTVKVKLSGGDSQLIQFKLAV